MNHSNIGPSQSWTVHLNPTIETWIHSSRTWIYKKVMVFYAEQIKDDSNEKNKNDCGFKQLYAVNFIHTDKIYLI